MRECTVCVADASAAESARLCEGLELHGYTAFGVTSGAEALAACQQGQADLLLLDINLPDLDGGEVRKRLLETPETRGIPVVCVVGREEDAEGSRNGPLSANGYVVKPYNLPMVMVRVDSVLRGCGTYETPSTGWFEDTVYTDPLTGLRNRQYLCERLGEELEKAHRYGMPISCLFLDICEVEAVDRELGMVSMDDLLAEVALALRNTSRVYDILARFDGCMFAAVLPHTPLEAAVHYANKIQNEMSATTFSDPAFPTRAKLSFGIVTSHDGQVRNAEQLMSEAMRNLLHASAGCEQGIVARALGTAG